MEREKLYDYDALEDSLESLHARCRSRLPGLFPVIGSAVILALALLPIVEVDVSVGAAGLVRPVTERVGVQSPVSGEIDEFLVVENQSVKKGDRLIVISSRALDERDRFNRAQQQEAQDQIADLAVEIAAAKSLSPGVLSGQKWEPVLIKAEFPATKLKTSYRAGQFEYFLSQIRASAIQLEPAMLDLQRYKTLHARGLATDQETDQKRVYVDSLLENQRQLFRLNVSKWQTEGFDQRTKILNLATEAQQIAEQKRAYTITAPLDGYAIGFVGLSAGTYLAAGSKLGEISPGDTIVVEAYVHPRDIGFVKLGQPAMIQVDAFSYSEWGTLRGTVNAISQDYVRMGDQVAFKVVIAVADPVLRKASGLAVAVMRGMTVNARFLVTRRSLFQLIYEKAGQWLDPSRRV